MRLSTAGIRMQIGLAGLGWDKVVMLPPFVVLWWDVCVGVCGMYGVLSLVSVCMYGIGQWLNVLVMLFSIYAVEFIIII